jgi:hypothetical protein
MNRAARLVALALLALALAPVARAAEAEPVKPADPAKPVEPVKPVEFQPNEIVLRALKAAEDAAVAAREAADATRASTEALRAAMKQGQEAAKAPDAKPPEEKKETPWVFNLGVNLISVSGNANAVTAKVGGTVTGKWGEWSANLKGSAAYGQTSVPSVTAPGTSDTTVTAQNGDLALRGDRAFSPKFGAYVTSGAAADHVASIQRQYFGEAGLGITWFEEKDADADWVRAKLRTDLGFRAMHEDRQKYFPEPDLAGATHNNIFAPRLTLAFRYALSKTAFFSQDAEVLPDIQTTNVRASAASVISAQIDKGVAITLGYKIRYIGVPPAGVKPTDTELGAGVNWTF